MVEFSEIFINLRFQSIANLVLSLLIIIFQLASIVSFPHDPYEKVGTGFWTGIVFAVTGFITWKSIDNYRYSRPSLVLAYVSICSGLILVGVYSGSLNHIERCADKTVADSSHLCPSHVALNVFLLILGLLATMLNILLAYSARLFLLSY